MNAPTKLFRVAWITSWALGFALFASAEPADAAPKAELWTKWQAHDPTARATIDHRAWDRFLSAHLEAGADGINRLRYGGVTPADRQVLSSYIGALGQYG